MGSRPEALPIPDWVKVKPTQLIINREYDRELVARLAVGVGSGFLGPIAATAIGLSMSTADISKDPYNPWNWVLAFVDVATPFIPLKSFRIYRNVDDVVPAPKGLIGATVDKFGPDDIVYGPSAGGKLREFQTQAGGKLLTDLPKPPNLSWEHFSIQTIEKQIASGKKLHFDITHMKDIPGILKESGKFADTVTAAELRHIHQNWDRIGSNVTFIRDGKYVAAPW